MKVLSNSKEYLRKSKKSRIGRFLVIFGLFLAMFLTTSHMILMPLRKQEHLWVYNDCKILWKLYGQFLRKLKFSLKGREKKNDTIT